jgi:hypothetical protein
MPAVPRLMKLVEDVAFRGERSDYELTRTWVVASDVIQAHLHRKSGGLKGERWHAMVARLVESYEPKPTVTMDGRVSCVW